MLMLPRFLALLHGARRRRRAGAPSAAPLLLTRSVFAELAFSMLLAPILMVQHTRAVVATILRVARVLERAAA